MFTILVPTFNRASLLKRCLTTILEQSFTKYEVFILDDNSSDETSNIVLEFTKDDRFKYIKFETNGGFLRNYRHVLSNNLNSYEWILLFSDDDGMGNTEYLRKCYECICKYPDIKLIAGEIVFDYDIFKLRSKRQELPEYFVVEDLSSLEFKLLTQKPSYNFHISTIKMFNLFGDNNGLTFEIPFEKICYQSAVGYVPEAEYLFAVHYQNRRNYLKLKQYFLSVMHTVYHGYPALKNFNALRAKNMAKENALALLSDDSSIFGAFCPFDIKAAVNIVVDLMDDDIFYEALETMGVFLEKFYQSKLDAKYLEFNEMLICSSEAKRVVESNNRFVIYGSNEWSSQIKQQLEKMGKHIVCTVDDNTDFKLDYVLELAANDKPQAIVLSSAKPSSIVKMIDNIKKMAISIDILTLIVADPVLINRPNGGC